MLTVTEYLCHKWPGICSVCRNHNSDLFLFITYQWVCNKSDMTGSTSGVWTVYLSGPCKFIPFLSDLMMLIHYISVYFYVDHCSLVFFFLLTICFVFSVLWITASDYIFVIFKVFLIILTWCKVSIILVLHWIVKLIPCLFQG